MKQDNSYSLNIIQGLSIIWAIIDNKSQYVTIRHNKTQYDTINKILIIIGVSSLENILTLLDLREQEKCRKENWISQSIKVMRHFLHKLFVRLYNPRFLNIYCMKLIWTTETDLQNNSCLLIFRNAKNVEREINIYCHLFLKIGKYPPTCSDIQNPFGNKYYSAPEWIYGIMFKINMCFSVIRQKTGVNEKYAVRPCKIPKGKNNDIIETLN